MFFAKFYFYRIRFSFLFFLVAIINSLIPTNSFAETSQRPSPGIYGYIENIEYDSQNRLINIIGWAFDSKAQRNSTELNVQIDGHAVKVKAFSEKSRDDLAQAFGTPTAQQAGFVLQIEPSIPLYPGSHQAAITAKFDHQTLPLTFLSGQPPTFSIQRLGTPIRHWAISGILIITIGLLIWSTRFGILEKMELLTAKNQQYFAFTLCGIFFLLVSLGITGSSLQLLLGESKNSNHPFISTDSGVNRLFYQPRPVRSDEWLVVTANTLAQVNHQPPFPITNRNLGLEGQNMLIVGMTGVPVWHLSAIGRPATWGFFFLPLSQALSWYWFFPFFACLLALWGLLNVLIPERAGRNLAVSLLFCLAPYAAGWSHWPLYTVFFPTAAVLLTIQILQPIGIWSSYWRGIALGLLLAGFALVLYPPWQITVASFYAILLITYLTQQRHKLYLRVHTALTLGTAVFLCGAILFVWWQDAANAIQAMRNTVYPGQRAALHGGDAPLFFLFRGYSNLETLTMLKDSVWNSSEFSSYMNPLIPLLFISIWLSFKRNPQILVWRGWLFFVSFLLVFQIFGIPTLIASLTFWNMVPSLRLDLALGLACIFAIALTPSKFEGTSTLKKTPILLLAIVSTLITTYGLLIIPQPFYSTASPLLVAAIAAVTLFTAYSILHKNIGQAIAINLFVYFISTWSFNPISIAPNNISLDATVKSFLIGSDNKRKKVLVLNHGAAESMSLLASGIPVIGGVFYYPQFKFWQQISHVPDEIKNTINRYQHLSFSSENFPEPDTYRIEATQLDAVKITIDPKRFDFSTTGAEIVASPENMTSLSSHSGLHHLGNHRGWSWYAVKSAAITKVGDLDISVVR